MEDNFGLLDQQKTPSDPCAEASSDTPVRPVHIHIMLAPLIHAASAFSGSNGIVDTIHAANGTVEHACDAVCRGRLGNAAPRRLAHGQLHKAGGYHARRP